jgi:peptide/nickel transport system substrate-binding protein
MLRTHAVEASRSRGKFEAWNRVLLCALGLTLWFSACVGEPSRSSHGAVVLLPRDPDEIDPRFLLDAYGLKISRLLYASLVTLDPETARPVPDLAESIEQRGPTTVRVVLRPQLAFADGTPLQAADVVETFLALRDPALGSRYRSSYDRVLSVTALDARTVEFTLDAPHAPFITDLEMPIFKRSEARRRGPLPTGSGPYVLVQRTPTELTLARNSHWHRPFSGAERLRFVVVHDENTRALRMLAGAGDLVQNVLSPLLVPLFERPGFAIKRARGVSTSYLGVNLESAAMGDLRVRQAIAHAIDRAALLRDKLGGRGTLATSFVPVGHWAHASDTPSYDYDPARSRALLRESGVALPLQLTLRTSSDRFAVSMARALSAMLAEVGIELTLRPSETATLLADLARGRFELTLMQLPELFEPHVLNWFFARERIPNPPTREGGNRFRFRSAALDALLEAGRRETELPKRAEIYRAAQRLLAQELPIIPLWHEDVVAVVSGRLADYKAPRDGRYASLPSTAFVREKTP